LARAQRGGGEVETGRGKASTMAWAEIPGGRPHEGGSVGPERGEASRQRLRWWGVGGACAKAKAWPLALRCCPARAQALAWQDRGGGGVEVVRTGLRGCRAMRRV